MILEENIEGDEAEIQILEEYNIWKENVPLLYDDVLQHSLVWPSLTIQFFPNQELNENYRTQKILLGTHTSGQEKEFLILADLHLPVNKSDVGKFVPRFQMYKQIPHEGEVTRARYMPQNQNIVATKSLRGRVDIFNISSDENNFLKSLEGHQEDGYGIDWDPFHQGWIASCGEDKLLNIWDVEKEINPIIQFSDIDDVIEDVSWSKKIENVVCCCGDDHSFILYDTRTKKILKKVEEAHDKEVYSVDFHPYTDHLFATASGDEMVKLWDLRKPEKFLAKLSNHNNEIYSVQWSPVNEHLIASSGADRRVMVWDVSKIGVGQSEEDAEDGPPELLFVHSGHKTKVNDICWSDKDELMLVSCDSGNVIQAWTMLDQIYYPLSYEVTDSELENENESFDFCF